MMPVALRTGAACVAVLVAGCGMGGDSATSRAEAAPPEVFEGPVSRAICGPGSMPETDIQGRVPVEDRQSGRSLQPYTCNLELVGKYTGHGANWQHAWYEDCAYYGTSFPDQQGVIVVDASDPADPHFEQALTTPAMLDPWESLKVNDKRGLLAGVAGWNLGGPVFFDLYDVVDDCRRPQLKGSFPMQMPIGHEGEWAPDGRTYYGSGLGTISAIDVQNPDAPLMLTTFNAGVTHGLNVSDDGTRGYMANIGGNGMDIMDFSGIQSRGRLTQPPVLGSVYWTDGSTAQHTIPLYYGDRKYVVFVDEGGSGMARMIDIADERNPVVVAKMKNEINMPDAEEARAADGGSSGFTYQGHYCGVDRRHNPTVLGCSYFWQGMRVFDIRDPHRPREIAYYNAGGNPSAPVGSQHGGGNAGYATAQVRFIPERGEVWYTDQDHGFFVLRFTNGAWPFKDSGGKGSR
jgi:hypothetical protein